MDAKRRKIEDKEAQKEAKLAERKRKQEEKEEEKKRKKEEREASRRKTKEESLGEISVVLDSAWAGGEEGEEVVSFLVGRGVQTRMEEASVANSVVWMRSKSDGVEVEEDHLLVKLEAKELGDLVVAGTLLSFAKEIKQRFPTKRLAFLVQGLDTYLKQQSNDAAKDYRKMVQSKMGGKEYSGGGATQRITKAKLDEALVWLQIEANCNIKMTNTTLESADYLFRLSAAIAYAPFRPQSAFENFCAEAVRKKGSGNMEQTWIAQLEQINGVSNNVARCIVNQYPTIKSLTDVYLYSNLSNAEKELFLQDIRIENGTNGGRRLGGALSKKIYQVFTVDDPSAVIH